MVEFSPEQWKVIERLLELQNEFNDALNYEVGEYCTNSSEAEEETKVAREAFESYKAQYIPKE